MQSRRKFALFPLLLVLMLGFGQALLAQSKNANCPKQPYPNVVACFPSPLFAESITAGGDGKLYASVSDFSTTCYIERFKDDGKNPEIWVAFPPEICENGFLLGVAFDEKGRLYVAFTTWTPSGDAGVYRVEPNRSLTRVLTLPPWSFPNGVAFYGEDLYVSDSVNGAIWKKSPHDKEIVQSVPWYQNPALLAPNGFGANGVAFYHNALFVAVADAGSIVRFPIQPDGGPGPWEYVVPPDSRLQTLDGIAFDVTGKLWFTVNDTSPGAGGKLGTVDKHGNVTILADNPGWLDYPTMVVFGAKPYNRSTLYLTNAGLNGGTYGMSNVLSFDVDVPGLPIPADH